MSILIDELHKLRRYPTNEEKQLLDDVIEVIKEYDTDKKLCLPKLKVEIKTC